MMNYRHLTQAEKTTVQAIAEDAGVVELLRLIGSIVAHNHFDITQGDKIRSEIFKIAKTINEDTGPDVK